MKVEQGPEREWQDAASEDALVFHNSLTLEEAAQGARQEPARPRTWNPLRHPICFALPRRVGPLSAWTEHIPFAMCLVDLVRPRLLVELGTYSGESYCAFCQAINELRLGTQCCAIDTWRGDPHTGFYGPEVLEELRRHHDALYGRFSRLIPSTFDDALGHFDDGSIDLLHLDGYHTYDAVAHDFEAWFPKLSSKGVVLFHDTAVRERDFGVRRFWQEIKAKYPSFEFPFCHGLGILAAGEMMPARLGQFLEAKQANSAIIDTLFHRLGRSLTLQVDATPLEASLQQQIHEGEAALREAVEAVNSARAQLREQQQIASELEVQLATSHAEREAEVKSLRTEREEHANQLRAKNAEQTSLLDAEREEHAAALASRIAQLAQSDEAQRVMREELNSKDRVIQELFDILGQRDVELREITTSAAWSVAQALRNLRKLLAPEGSRRERAWKSGRRSLRAKRV